MSSLTMYPRPVAPALRHRARPLRLGARVFLCAALLLGAARADVSKEYRLKAAFLYNFTRFVEWPAARFADDSSPIVIGVLGRNPFADELEKAVRGRNVNGRSLVVKTVAAAGDAAAVHLLFVPAGDESRLAADGAWRGVGVVSVGESARFTALGGTITFVQEADKVRFVINLQAAEQANLKFSAQLLKLATEVYRKP